MYPLKFENVYFEKIWGGRDFESFRANLPKGNIGESWDVACHSHGMSVVINGEYKGKTLQELMEQHGRELLGTEIIGDGFPLLVKLINAKEKLSVQVHPEDEYAYRVEGEPGKTEVWYIVEAEEGASLIVGTKPCTREQFKAALKNGELENYLQEIVVKKGQVYFIESGLVHAIGRGLVIAEIQQNSDTTYRVYDYNRGREIHIEKALDVVKFQLKGEESKGIITEHEGYRHTVYCRCPYFVLEKLDVDSSYYESSDKERFFIYTCVEGRGQLSWGDESIEVCKGDSILIPAAAGKYQIEGKLSLLKTYVPHK